MKRISVASKVSIVIILCIACKLTSCNTEDNKPCGCKSGETKAINNDLASVCIHKDKPVLISLEKGFLSPCNSILAFENGSLLKDLSGNIKSTCQFTLDTVIRFNKSYAFKSSYFDIMSYSETNESIFDNPIIWKNYKITIINSEDYGYPRGFGCLITNLNSGVNINMAILPLEGFVTCKSRLDAARVAFYYVHKMYKFKDDLVGMDDWELSFIRVN